MYLLQCCPVLLNHSEVTEYRHLRLAGREIPFHYAPGLCPSLRSGWNFLFPQSDNGHAIAAFALFARTE
jgi:hypothetical protein